VDEAADRCGVLGVYSFLPAICAPVETHANQVASLATHAIFSTIGYQLLIKLFKVLLPSYSYFRYLCYMHIFLGL
jgi:hypothetical protein